VKCDKGALFWCKGYDFNSGYHWCDWSDGRWKSNGVNYKCMDSKALISISCKDGQSGTTKGHVNKATDEQSVRIMGTAQDSGQVTTCENGKEHVGSVVTCNGPKVTWGSHTGVPHKHSNNKYDAYCQSLGFAKFVPGSDKYGTVRCDKGALFWCKGYDFSSGYHWCDWSDGRWKTNGLQYKCQANRALISITCKGTDQGGGAKPPSNLFGKAKDSGQSTTCTGGKVKGSGTVTCKIPKVTWGSHTGVPHRHSGNNYNTYCKSMGYTGFVPGSDKYGTVSCSKGALFGCSGYDFNGWHWCDWSDGRWKNNGLQWKCMANTALVSITCKGTDQG